MKAVVLGGTSGIGKAIAENLSFVCDSVIATGRKDIDTTSLKSVYKFSKKNYGPDILVLNTGGPPDLKINEINDKIWIENFNKLFLSFFNLIKNIGVKKNGYIFLISSYVVKEPSEELIISSSIRAGFVSLFKSLSKIYKKNNIKFINIAPGPIKTKRLVGLLKKSKISIKKFENELPGKKIPDPDEIGKFVKFIVENRIISLNGVTIPFDGNLLKGL